MKTYLQFDEETSEWKIGLKSSSDIMGMNEVFWKVRDTSSEAKYIAGTWQERRSDGSWIPQGDMRLMECYGGNILV